MARFNFKLMSEEHGPKSLAKNAVPADREGFDFVYTSDHYHLWLFAHGHASFAWSALRSRRMSSWNASVALLCL